MCDPIATTVALYAGDDERDPLGADSGEGGISHHAEHHPRIILGRPTKYRWMTY